MNRLISTHVFDKVLNCTSGREGVDRLVVVPVHIHHLLWDMQPPVYSIVDWLDKDNVKDEGGQGGTRVDLADWGEEHRREEALEQHLAPHVHHHWDEVVVSFAIELTLRHFHDRGSLLVLSESHNHTSRCIFVSFYTHHKHPMSGQHKLHNDHTNRPNEHQRSNISKPAMENQW